MLDGRIHPRLSCAIVLGLSACGTSTAPGNEPVEAFAPDPDRYYVLQTVESAAGNRCLEGNLVDPSSTLGGAAFMDACQDVSGQAWRFVADGGAYRMQTMFLEPEGKCLEGNQMAPGAILDGAAFMDDCADAPGQLWSIVPAGVVHFHLKTAEGGSDECLDGNRVTQGATAGGGAFMDACTSASDGQLWFATGR